MCLFLRMRNKFIVHLKCLLLNERMVIPSQCALAYFLRNGIYMRVVLFHLSTVMGIKQLGLVLVVKDNYVIGVVHFNVKKSVVLVLPSKPQL